MRSLSIVFYRRMLRSHITTVFSYSCVLLIFTKPFLEKVTTGQTRWWAILPLTPLHMEFSSTDSAIKIKWSKRYSSLITKFSMTLTRCSLFSVWSFVSTGKQFWKSTADILFKKEFKETEDWQRDVYCSHCLLHLSGISRYWIYIFPGHWYEEVQMVG